MTSLPTPLQSILMPGQNLPTMYDLPSEHIEEPAFPDGLRFLQAMLLMLTFMPPNWEKDMVFSAADLHLYYDANHPKWYKCPDWFGVVGVPRLYQERDSRLSYVIWQEKVSPFVVIEFLPPGTEDEDLGNRTPQPGRPPLKWEVYEQILRVPYYVVFSRYTNEMQAFRLINNRYQPAPLTQGRLLVPELQLSLGLWQGVYRSLDRLWLRWMTLAGDVVSLDSEELIEAQEQITEARERIIEERERAIAAEEKNEQLKALLLEMGVDPERLP
ncbi:MAG: Uma2 family endonuclease [Oscillatoria sp. SIO1A7]|nr:Uma2 family endonuclease [Oscillatoria sp. SIO1A7]